MMKAHLQQPSAADKQSEAELSAQFSKAVISTLPPLENRAAQSHSPYVRAHANTLVAWQLLDDEAIERAKKDNKLIFLNIGFKSCHYCRLTTLESFSHPEVANLLNTSFVPIIVDREERPDIDTIYMNYNLTINGAGGWPLNVFLTPDLEPVFGGTYWPSPGQELLGLDGEELRGEDRLDFLVILQRMRKVWQEQAPRCRQEAKDIVKKLRDFAAEGTLGTRKIDTSDAINGAAVPAVLGTPMTTSSSDLELDLDQLEEAYKYIAGTFDTVNGGFGMAPKFPTPAKLSFLLSLANSPSEVADVVGEAEVQNATHIALHTLRKLRDGGLRDHVGGGFHRYAVTTDWAIPHFEKMVVDNALLLESYLDAWLNGKNGRLNESDEFANVVFELAEYLTSPPILRPDGNFATSEAADSYYRKGDAHQRVGAYYLWTRREFDNAFGQAGTSGQQASVVAAAHWNVLQHGNVPREHDPNDEFINQNVLYTVKDATELGRQFGIAPEEVQRLIETARGKLRAHQEKERVRPETDDKVVTSINAMAIAVLARTSAVIREIDPHKSQKCLAVAKKAASFIKENLWDSHSKVLYRSYLDGRSSTQGFAEDYAFLIRALLALYNVTGEESWLEWADELQKIQIKLFYDPTTGMNSRPVTPMAHHSSCGGFYSTIDEAPQVILRLKDGMDTAQPSTNAVSTSNLFHLGTILADKEYMETARETINAFEVETLQYPWLFIGLLGAVITARLGATCQVTETVDSEVCREAYKHPHREVRSLVFLKSKSWLEKRNPLLSGLTAGSYQFRGDSYKVVV